MVQQSSPSTTGGGGVAAESNGDGREAARKSETAAVALASTGLRQDRDDLCGWLEREVKSRLVSIEAKLELALTTTLRVPEGRTDSAASLPYETPQCETRPNADLRAMPCGAQSRKRSLEDAAKVSERAENAPPVHDSTPIALPKASDAFADEASQPPSSSWRIMMMTRVHDPESLERSVLVPESLESSLPVRQVSNFSWAGGGEDSVFSAAVRSRRAALVSEAEDAEPLSNPGGKNSRPSSLLRLTHWLQARNDRQGVAAEKVWHFLEDPESSAAASWYEKISPSFILLSVAVTLMQSVENTKFEGVNAAVLEMCIETLFLIEIVARFVVCPRKRVFFLNYFNLFDLISCVPLGVRVAILIEFGEQSDAWVRRNRYAFGLMMGCVPVLRLIKVLRHFTKMILLVKAFRLALEALPVMLFSYFLIVLVFTVLVFISEPPGVIGSLPQAMWLTFVSMTTVGYGDVVPMTSAGQLVVSVLVLTTMLYTSIPLGIIGNAFSEVWRDRDRILLMGKTRNRLDQWGYTARDIPKLFRLFDMNRDGELDIEEFRHMVAEMRLGLTDRRVIELFDLFDGDGSGAIDDREFVKGLFPESYHDTFGFTTEEDDSSQSQLRRGHGNVPPGVVSDREAPGAD